VVTAYHLHLTEAFCPHSLAMFHMILATERLFPWRALTGYSLLWRRSVSCEVRTDFVNIKEMTFSLLSFSPSSALKGLIPHDVLMMWDLLDASHCVHYNQFIKPFLVITFLIIAKSYIVLDMTNGISSDGACTTGLLAGPEVTCFHETRKHTLRLFNPISVFTTFSSNADLPSIACSS
jgi:hypothetical protein